MAFKRLTDTFQQTSCLTELHLGLVCSPRRGWLRRLLQSLPQTLRSIEVRWNQLNEDYEADYYPVQVWPEAYPCLESADFVINLLAEEQLTLTQFLERCRALRRCRLPTTESPESLSRLVTLLGSSKTFPILDTVDFGLTVELNGSDWERLLVLMKGRIKGIATCVPLTLPNNRHFISEMTKQWSETLEDICIGQPLSMSGSDIHLILTSCRKLRKFDCLHNRIVWPMTGRPGRADAYPGPDMVAIGQDDEIVAANWVCLELEELRLMFRDGRSKDDPQEQWTKAAVRYIYQQLGRLSNLKELAIGWKTTAALADCVNLDMSLESGLGYMKDLKALKKIDINHIHRTMIRQDEAEWMMTHWPSLTEIRGLEYQIDSTDEEGLDTMDWLRETRPQLTIE
ncbi:hypothetical protein BGX31_008597 [Mortierella sp. GBA43]|nr:hypothetical protein BGX31_008597 [Mortierella sp. GBA43]